MDKSEVLKKIREHLGTAKSCALMMANAQSAVSRTDYLKRLSEQLKNATTLLDKLEGA